MAITTAHTAEATRATGVAAIFDLIGNALVRLGEMSEGARAARHAAALTQLSDTQLRTMGIKREDIVEHAFAHLRRG